MSDVADIASEVEEQRLANILANRPKPSMAVSATECEECSAEIPEARRKAIPGVQCCVACAQLNEDSLQFQQGRYR